MIELPNIMAMVLAVFLSPALPDGMITVGETTCQEANAILQQQNLKLVDTEFLSDFDARKRLLVAEPMQALVAVQTLSWERQATLALSGRNQRSFFKKEARPRVGVILCGFFAGEEFPQNPEDF